MAIDTAEKRRSVSGLPFFPFGPAVTPNASQDVEWRQQAGWGYSGITPAESQPAGSVLNVTSMHLSMTLRL